MTTSTFKPFTITDKESDYLLKKLKDGEKTHDFEERGKKKYVKVMTELERRVDKITSLSVYDENKVYDGGRLLTLFTEINTIVKTSLLG